jgi:hypothetical protein
MIPIYTFCLCGVALSLASSFIFGYYDFSVLVAPEPSSTFVPSRLSLFILSSAAGAIAFPRSYLFTVLGS